MTLPVSYYVRQQSQEAVLLVGGLIGRGVEMRVWVSER
jgi:hypothetical protein